MDDRTEIPDIDRHLDQRFSRYVQNEQTHQIRIQLQERMQRKYENLIARGFRHKDAVKWVIANHGGYIGNPLDFTDGAFPSSRPSGRVPISLLDMEGLVEAHRRVHHRMALVGTIFSQALTPSLLVIGLIQIFEVDLGMLTVLIGFVPTLVIAGIGFILHLDYTAGEQSLRYLSQRRLAPDTEVTAWVDELTRSRWVLEFSCIGIGIVLMLSGIGLPLWYGDSLRSTFLTVPPAWIPILPLTIVGLGWRILARNTWGSAVLFRLLIWRTIHGART